MPGLNGIEVASALREKDPDLPVVLISGWTHGDDDERLSDAGVSAVVHKPCLIETLLDAAERYIRR